MRKQSKLLTEFTSVLRSESKTVACSAGTPAPPADTHNQLVRLKTLSFHMLAFFRFLVHTVTPSKVINLSTWRHEVKRTCGIHAVFESLVALLPLFQSPLLLRSRLTTRHLRKRVPVSLNESVGLG